MKKWLFFFGCTFFIQYGIAQNTFPSSGSAGIGTTSPRALLDVATHISDGALGAVLARQVEGDFSGTYLGVKAWGTQSVYGGKSFSLEHAFYGDVNNAINFYRGWATQGGFMTFATNDGAEKMRIDAYGNIGIGTTTPTIIGGYAGITINNPMGSLIDLQSNGNTVGRLVGTATDTYMQNTGSGGIIFSAGGADRMITTAAGNVGIGTNSPSYKLEVNGNALARGYLRSTANTPEGGAIYLDNPSKTGGNASTWTIFNMTGGYGNGLNFWKYGSNGNVGPQLQLMDNGISNINGTLVVNGSQHVFGDVAIGTTASQKDLLVNGNIKTRKVKVTINDWPDYVFDSSYQLTPLNHVEKFIEKNKHLPGMPSAEEVKKDGLELGDNQAALLKKIEELTLYTISQDKQLVEQKHEITSLQARLLAIEKMLGEQKMSNLR